VKSLNQRRKFTTDGGANFKDNLVSVNVVHIWVSALLQGVCKEEWNDDLDLSIISDTYAGGNNTTVGDLTHLGPEDEE